jgi:hypothetical protein
VSEIQPACRQAGIPDQLSYKFPNEMPYINIITTRGEKVIGLVNAQVTFRPNLKVADINFPPNDRSLSPATQTVNISMIPDLGQRSVFDRIDKTRDTFTRLL